MKNKAGRSILVQKKKKNGVQNSQCGALLSENMKQGETFNKCDGVFDV